MRRSVSRRSLLAATAAAALVAAYPKSALAAPKPATGDAPDAEPSPVIAVAGVAVPEGSRTPHYGYRLLAPAGRYATVARQTSAGASPQEALRVVLADLRGQRVVVRNGLADDFRQALASVVRDASDWPVGKPSRSDRLPTAGLEVIAFLPAAPMSLSGRTRLSHRYAVPRHL